MIHSLRGTLLKKTRDGVVVETGGVGYEVMLPGAVAAQLENLRPGDEIALVISYHLIATPSRITPLLVGFTNDVEKEFFEQFITVAGFGPKAATRALALPFARVAQAIMEGDDAALTRLPGVGRKRAEDIIHQLRDKVAAAAFCRAPEMRAAVPAAAALTEAAAILAQLGYGRGEIDEMLAAVGEGARQCEAAEEVLALVYAARRPKA
jgi:Holliday junction DNA helicase RuvA